MLKEQNDKFWKLRDDLQNELNKKELKLDYLKQLLADNDQDYKGLNPDNVK